MLNHTEEWRAIAGYDGDYQVSSLGRIKSLKRKNPFIMSPGTHRAGYKKVVLYRQDVGKTFFVHRLVAAAFLGLGFDKAECNHKDGDKSNNQAVNLEWVSASQNIVHALCTGLRNPARGIKWHTSKLTDAQVLEIFKDKSPQRDIALRYGISQNAVFCIKAGKTWRHVTMP